MAAAERLFFALNFNERERAAIARWRDGLSLRDCRPVPRDNLHLTLRFLGDTPASLQERLIAAAQTIALPAFELQLDRSAYWSGSRVALLLPSLIPPALLKLQTHLEQLAQSFGYPPEHRNFKPHVTLARHCADFPSRLAPRQRCQISQFVLMRSVQTRYEVLACFPLVSHADDPFIDLSSSL